MFEHEFWNHVQGWWNARGLPNVLLVHYADLRADTDTVMRRIAEFLDIDVEADLWPKIHAQCTIDYMRRQAAHWDLLEMIFDGGGNSFINKGVNGRWKDVLTAEEIAKADRVAEANLSPDCARWLRTGEVPEFIT